MPYSHPSLPKAPLPSRVIFDPFNSSSTGHQRAELPQGGTGWRDSRSYKLAHQFRDASGHGGREHVLDRVGAGSADGIQKHRKINDGAKSGAAAPAPRDAGLQDIKSFMSVSRKRKYAETNGKDNAVNKRPATSRPDLLIDKTSDTTITVDDGSDGHNLVSAAATTTTTPLPEKQLPQIFRGLTMYLNGSTAPLVSDHKLKQLFVQHGGNSSIALGRRTVTHVVLGKTCGGGLASGKFHKEVSTVGGKGIKYVTAQWVLDCIKKADECFRGIQKGVEGTCNMAETSTLLALPAELRYQIYEHLFNPTPSYMIHAGYHPTHPKTETRTIGFNSSILFTCKKLYFEAFAVLCNNFNLHVTFYRHNPYQPNIPDFLPAHLFPHVRNVIYQLHSSVDDDRPPKIPFNFRLFPNLKRFVIRKPFRVNVDMLYEPEQGRLTRGQYEEFDDAKKLCVWARTGLIDSRPILGSVARYGSGGWLSALVQPEIFGHDRSEGAPTNILAPPMVTRNTLEVPKDCQIIVEADVMLYVGQTWNQHRIETIVFDVDVQTRTVGNPRFISREERRTRDMQADRTLGKMC